MKKEKAGYKQNSNKAQRLTPTIEKKQQKISYEENQIKKKEQSLDKVKSKQNELTKEVKRYQEAEENAAISSEEAWK
jgi:uncharacterized protein (DUF3084 family)